MTDYLTVYLRNQLAHSVTWRALARRARDNNKGTALGEALAEVADGIAEAVRTFETIMRALGVRPNPAKLVLAAAGERFGRLKRNGWWVSYSPLSRFVQLEGIAMGMEQEDPLVHAGRARRVAGTVAGHGLRRAARPCRPAAADLGALPARGWHAGVRREGVTPRRGHGRGRQRVQDLRSARSPVAAAQRWHRSSRWSVVSASQRASSHSTCGKRRNPALCNGMPQSVWLVPIRQACTDPRGARTPSSSSHWSDAATAGSRRPAISGPSALGGFADG
jgi:hypothetical protein